MSFWRAQRENGMRVEIINKFLLGKTMQNTKISLILPPKSSDTKKDKLKKEFMKILRNIQKLSINKWSKKKEIAKWHN